MAAGARLRSGVGGALPRLRSACRLLAGLGLVLFSVQVAAGESGVVKGRLTYDGEVYVLEHVYAWQPPFQNEELWIYLTDRALPLAAAQHPELPEQLARDKHFGGIKLIVHPTQPRLDDIKGVVYAPREDGFSLDRFNFGPSWQALTIADRQVAGQLRTGWMSWTLEAEFSASVAGSTGTLRTITGAAAQQSAPAAAFVAFEQALIVEGLDAAAAYLTPAKLTDLRARIERLGEASFREFQDRQRVGLPRGEARRRQIEQVDIDGDYAQLSTRAGPDGVHTALLVQTAGGWKIAEW